MKVNLCKEHKQESNQSEFHTDNCVLCEALNRADKAEAEVKRLKALVESAYAIEDYCSVDANWESSNTRREMEDDG